MKHAEHQAVALVAAEVFDLRTLKVMKDKTRRSMKPMMATKNPLKLNKQRP